MRPFYNEAQVPIAGGEVLRLVLDFRAIDTIESLTGQSMDDVLPQLANPPHGLATKVLWAMLREHHETLTLDQAMGIVVDKRDGPRVGVKMAEVLNRAYDLGEAKGKNPQKRRGRSMSSGKNG